MDFQAEYNNRARVPEHPQIIAGWERDAAAYRAERSRRSELGLRYGDHPRQTIDLFHPDEPVENNALVVLIHGGYWRSLHPSSFSHWAAGANRHGCSAAILGYRLCPEVGVADIIADARSAALFLHRSFGKRLVACGHSAGGHLASTLVATDWRSFGADVPAGLVSAGIGISGVFDLAPLIETEMNEQLQLDASAARAVSPAFWPVPAGVTFQALVGGEESPEFLRQSRLLVERWSAAGARTHFEVLRGANHFTSPAGLTDPASAIVAALIELAAPQNLDPPPPLP